MLKLSSFSVHPSYYSKKYGNISLNSVRWLSIKSYKKVYRVSQYWNAMLMFARIKPDFVAGKSREKEINPKELFAHEENARERVKEKNTALFARSTA